MRYASRDKVTVIIPVLNEEAAIGRVIRRVKEEGYSRIIVVDGFSTDDTLSIALKNGAEVYSQQGSGKTGAIATAIKHVETPYMVVLDGDCTYDPKDIENLLTCLREADLVIGVRAIGRGNIPLFNRIGNLFINMTFNVLMGTDLVDVCSGMYCLRTDFARKLDFMTKGFDVEIEIAAQASKYGVIAQVPIRYHARVGVQKLRPIKDGFQIVLSVFRMAFRLNLSSLPRERAALSREIANDAKHLFRVRD